MYELAVIGLTLAALILFGLLLYETIERENERNYFRKKLYLNESINARQIFYVSAFIEENENLKASIRELNRYVHRIHNHLPPNTVKKIQKMVDEIDRDEADFTNINIDDYVELMAELGYVVEELGLPQHIVEKLYGHEEV